MRMRKRRRNILKIIFSYLILTVIVAAFGFGLFLLLNQSIVAKYETRTYNASLQDTKLFAEDLCIVNNDVVYNKFETEHSFYAASLFNLSDNSVLMAENVHEQIYPASTTKLLTFYIAVKYGDLDEIVTVNKSAAILPSSGSRAWLKEGDQKSLKDLMYSVMIGSGKDSEIAVAQEFSGTE